MRYDGAQMSEHAGPETFSKVLVPLEAHELRTAGMPIGRCGADPCLTGLTGSPWP